jgi:hypothetical protein
VPEDPARDGYVTPTGCAMCGEPLHGRADQCYCSHTCRQAAHRRRTSPRVQPPQLPKAHRGLREGTVYECGDCGQRLAGEQWCPDCQRPCRRIGPGGPCPSCGDPITFTDLIEAPMA